MKFLFSVLLISFLVFFFSCKTTTDDEPTVSSSSSQPLEEPEEVLKGEKPKTIIVPTGSLGDISKVQKNMLEKTLESSLDDYFDIVPKDLFEQAQEKAFEELDYDECTEDQCVLMIKEFLQVENSFQLFLMEEDGVTQISLTWNDLDKKIVKEHYCEGCKTLQIKEIVGSLTENLIKENKNLFIKKRDEILQNNDLNKSERVYVTVGFKGTILTSVNGLTWKKEKSGTDLNLKGITFGKGQFLAVGQSGTILSSESGDIWEKRKSNSKVSLSSVAYGNGLFVVVGLNGTILTSSNGISWTNRNSKTKVILYEVTYGNGLFIAVGEQGIILSSEDGRNWRKTITRKTANLHGVTYHDGLYVTVGYDYGAKGGSFIFISLDGYSWTLQRTSGISEYLNSVTYGNGLFVAIGWRNIFTSKNGLDWIESKIESKSRFHGITYGNDEFIAVGIKGNMISSSNGKIWFQRASTEYPDTLNGITFSK